VKVRGLSRYSIHTNKHRVKEFLSEPVWALALGRRIIYNDFRQRGQTWNRDRLCGPPGRQKG
jgi:hypothetical protein